jgi:indole-3-glycerol phosphate synthase
MSILDDIIAAKRVEIDGRRRREPVEDLRRLAGERGRPPSLTAALRQREIGLIAEVKRRSPSAGILREPFDPAAIAAAYEGAGADGVSVLVDGPHFGGGDEAVRAARAATVRPILYKEFVVDPWQIAHAASLGASAVLLLAGVLGRDAVIDFTESARSLGLECLLEVHDDEEMALARSVGAPFVGINNRDLKTFTVDLAVTERLAKSAPDGCTLVSESGIRTPEDVVRLREAGAHAILVGQQLLENGRDPAESIRELMSRVRPCAG